jgi:molybdate/tungstate transport system substrate-binding protein
LNTRGFLVLTFLIIIAIASIGMLIVRETKESPEQIVVCNAGSLTIPLKQLAHEYSSKTGVKILLEPSGSVDAVRKVTDLHKNCDLVALADYRLIPLYMYPKYADWYIEFASNRLVLVETHENNDTTLAQALTNMLNGKAKYGFSDPNRDPCGYRSVGAIALLSITSNNVSILENLVIKKIPGSYYNYSNGKIDIYIPSSFTPQDNLVVRPKSIQLISLLETGEIDYAFEYQSVAVQHNLSYIQLPDTVNLGDPQLSSYYSRVTVHILVGTSEEKAITMAPIVYGFTVPKTAKNSKQALEFAKYLIENGGPAFNKLGQPFLEKPIGNGNIPPQLVGLVEESK